MTRDASTSRAADGNCPPRIFHNRRRSLRPRHHPPIRKMPTTPVNKYKTFLALAFLLFGFAFAATADDQVVLLLKNGDRVTGTITLEKTNEVIIATTWAKEVAIPLS